MGEKLSGGKGKGERSEGKSFIGERVSVGVEEEARKEERGKVRKGVEVKSGVGGKTIIRVGEKDTTKNKI